MNQAVHRGIISTIGSTPLVELTRLLDGFPSRVFMKMERHNPGGSIEDRTALSLVREVIRREGRVPDGSLAVEICTPELAVSLAQVCRYYGIDFLALMEGGAPDPFPALLTAYGARHETVAPGTAPERMAEIIATVSPAFRLSTSAAPVWPQEDSDTMREIAEALENRVDLVLCDLAYPRTLGGCAEFARIQGLDTAVIGVSRGPAPVPTGPLAIPFGVDDVVWVDPKEAALMRERLLGAEGLLADSTAGAAAAALVQLAHRIPAGSNCVIVAPAGGDRCPENFEHKEATPC
ncbi:pyridoxal-phosphate dependent enzyme [Streptomyces sp. NBC_01264]|uniref:pyridoxal-phosphate dependent enzyme n=1 Tax=Streptomyces sp. NBC_01264 TaxID=2903804 RepID=UPI00225BEE6E|nr:pyridoxal-phosphate dependent enzyme [Streptomyces sp. NBC_01264]MCX4783687.1 pyridoxal-phosphate dependent enzyme [Streptomyces sp. NBC_01264]